MKKQQQSTINCPSSAITQHTKGKKKLDNASTNMMDDKGLTTGWSRTRRSKDMDVTHVMTCNEHTLTTFYKKSNENPNFVNVHNNYYYKMTNL